MTVFRTRAERAIARSRGHLRQAEQFVAHESPFSAQFSINKASHALQIGMLHEASRAAEAHEMRAIMQFLSTDPESDLGDIVAPEEAEALQVMVRNWLLSKIEAVEDIGDDE